MSSSLLSRFRLGTDIVNTSIYETIREHEDELEQVQDEISDGNLNRDEWLRASSVRARTHRPRAGLAALRKGKQPNAFGQRRRVALEQSNLEQLPEFEDIEDDVPASLLIEDVEDSGNNHTVRTEDIVRADKPLQMHPEWDDTPPQPVRTSEQLPIYENEPQKIGISAWSNINPTEKALWRWANIENLDNFLADVYDYYMLKGFWSILLKRFLNLLTVAFVVGFCLFLTQCVNYDQVRGSTQLSDILVHKCTARMGFVPNLILWLTTFICIVRTFQYILDIRQLKNMHDFYLYLLHVPESEIQSISWPEIVSRLMVLRDSNPNIKTSARSKGAAFLGAQDKQRMDAHDIANRLMRKDNYMIALINKDVLNTSLVLPLLGECRFFTRTLEWHLNYCIMDYVFNSQGQPHQLFLKDTHRKALSEGLTRRFVFAGTTSLMFAPFLILYFLVQNFFQYFNEYQKDPSQIGSRQYNVYAQWKFREFNELWHFFGRRLKMSQPFASRYINQFPKDKTVQLARFVTFVSGAVVSVLGLATVLDQENFLSFEITPGRTAIFYLGTFGAIWAAARGLLPDDDLVYDSAYSMEEVVEFTHYKPSHWVNRLHTIEVKDDFSKLYQMRVVVLLEEILSMIFTPFVLWFSLPHCSERIIDFFREHTVHVDGLGYVCSFAEFNFKKPGQTGTGDNAGTRTKMTQEHVVEEARAEYFADKDNKMEQSYYHFMNDYDHRKTGIRFPSSYHRRRSLHSPPPIPGPSSSRDRLVRRGMSRLEDSVTSRVLPDSRILGQTAAHLPTRSLLLDARHQPERPGLQSSSKPPTPPAVGKAMLSTSDITEKNNSKHGSGEVMRSYGEPHGQAGQSEEELGSWKHDAGLQCEMEEEEDLEVLAQGGGVLGLIRQFQRAHDDDKRGNAGI